MKLVSAPNSIACTIERHSKLISPHLGTGKVEIYPSTLPDGTKLFLVDTPGFDDTYKSDTEILMEVANWLSGAYEKNIGLTGIIYLHRILDVRLGGAAMRNLRMFKKLCGEKSLASVVLATTRWSNVTSEEGAQREQELCTNDRMWKRMIDNKSKVFRHDRDEVSALEIIQYLVKRGDSVTLDIQKDLVDKGLSLDQTAAGQEIQAEIDKQRKGYEKQIQELREEMQEALAKRDQELQEDLEAERAKLEFKLAEAREMDRKLQADREQLRQQMEEEARRERNELLEKLRQQDKLLAREEARLEEIKDRNRTELERHKLELQLQQARNEAARLQQELDRDTGCIVM